MIDLDYMHSLVALGGALLFDGAVILGMIVYYRRRSRV